MQWCTRGGVGGLSPCPFNRLSALSVVLTPGARFETRGTEYHPHTDSELTFAPTPAEVCARHCNNVWKKFAVPFRKKNTNSFLVARENLV